MTYVQIHSLVNAKIYQHPHRKTENIAKHTDPVGRHDLLLCKEAECRPVHECHVRNHDNPEVDAKNKSIHEQPRGVDRAITSFPQVGVKHDLR